VRCADGFPFSARKTAFSPSSSLPFARPRAEASYSGIVFDVVLPVVQVLLAAFLTLLVLMHSGRDTGFGGMGYTPASQGGQHIVERNLTRLTVLVAALFGINTIALFYVL
jgi:preprotein translocase subunit SecG